MPVVALRRTNVDSMASPLLLDNDHCERGLYLYMSEYKVGELEITAAVVLAAKGKGGNSGES